MRGIYCKEYGDADVMTYDENIPKPSPTKTQVLINVKAAGVNPADTYIRTGTVAVKPPLPYVPGMDGAGVITELGADVNNFQKARQIRQKMDILSCISRPVPLLYIMLEHIKR